MREKDHPNVDHDNAGPQGPTVIFKNNIDQPKVNMNTGRLNPGQQSDFSSTQRQSMVTQFQSNQSPLPQYFPGGLWNANEQQPPESHRSGLSSMTYRSLVSYRGGNNQDLVQSPSWQQ